MSFFRPSARDVRIAELKVKIRAVADGETDRLLELVADRDLQDAFDLLCVGVRPEYVVPYLTAHRPLRQPDFYRAALQRDWTKLTPAWEPSS